MYSIHIIAISKTHLDNSFDDTAVAIQGYNIYRRDRYAYGGGIAVQSWPKVLRITQILIFTVCCHRLYDGNLHILQNVMKSDQMNCN